MTTRGHEEFNNLVWSLDVPKMDQKEIKFIFGYVKYLIEHEKELSDKQKRWLQYIICKHTRHQQVISDYE
jgi:hypothetical protein